MTSPGENSQMRNWTHDRCCLLLTTRLLVEPEFSTKIKKRYLLWEEILQRIKQVDETFPFTRDDITRKYLNFMVTYKRIKNRHKITGCNTTSWEYFDKMDEVYGQQNEFEAEEEKTTPPANHSFGEVGNMTPRAHSPEYSEECSPIIPSTPSTPEPAKRPPKRHSTPEQYRNKVAKTFENHWQLTAAARPTNESNRDEVFGMNVTLKMKDIDNRIQKILAEKLINEALFMAEMGYLNVAHSICPSPMQFTNIHDNNFGTNGRSNYAKDDTPSFHSKFSGFS